MSVVYKYPFIEAGAPVSTITVPGLVLHVDFDPSKTLCAWALVEPDAANPATVGGAVSQTVTVVGTGEPLPYGQWRPVNSFISGPYVFHAFRSLSWSEALL